MPNGTQRADARSGASCGAAMAAGVRATPGLPNARHSACAASMAPSRPARSWTSIRFRPEASRWHKANGPFELALFHEGWLFDRPVKLNEITSKGVAEIPFDAAAFDYTGSRVDPAAIVPPPNLPHA